MRRFRGDGVLGGRVSNFFCSGGSSGVCCHERHGTRPPPGLRPLTSQRTVTLDPGGPGQPGQESDPTLGPRTAGYTQEHYSKTAHRAQLCFRYVVRELAALLPVWGVKRVPDRVRDERGAALLQGPRVAAELETSRGEEDHRGAPPPRRVEGRGPVVGASERPMLKPTSSAPAQRSAASYDFCSAATTTPRSARALSVRHLGPDERDDDSFVPRQHSLERAGPPLRRRRGLRRRRADEVNRPGGL